MLLSTEVTRPVRLGRCSDIGAEGGVRISKRRDLPGPDVAVTVAGRQQAAVPAERYPGHAVAEVDDEGG